MSCVYLAGWFNKIYDMRFNEYNLMTDKENMHLLRYITCHTECIAVICMHNEL